ncbi:ATP-dependent DNA helicase RecG [Elusimicrobiota bacterium]
MNLYSEVKYLKGIGPKRASALAKIGINTVENLLTFFPRDYQDRTRITPVINIFFSQHYCVFGKIINAYEKNIAKGLAIFCADIEDNTGVISVKFFRKFNPYSKYDIFSTIRNQFIKDKYVYIYGTCEIQFGQKQITAEDYEFVENENDMPLFFKKLIPVYDLTAGITQKFLLSVINNAVKNFVNFYPDLTANLELIKNKNFLPIAKAIEKIHFPKDLTQAEFARQSFAIQEFLILQIALQSARSKIKKQNKIQKYEIKKNLLSQFKNQLPFEFTKAQKKVINEIFTDMTSDKIMNRMLMGDVGSGKTIVALSAILLAVENNFQAVIIAPTEILAEQHYLTFSNILKGIKVNIVLVTSSTMKSKKQREEILALISDGSVNIIIGTHSIMEERVKFKNLSLVVVDEQHRFGVMQKVSALAKGTTPDILMMTATPIPRGLAMTIYGEMAVSIIDELPPMRTPVETICSDENTAYQKVLEEIKNGGQIYMIYPLVDESDKIELKSAVTEAENLSQTVFKNVKVGLLHGKMKPKEKNEIMTNFKNKKFDILIATTVIEVGIDVPNATIIVIQHADRFGLATLHQLRGRVGRGRKKSYCFLISDSKSRTAKQRLEIMTKTTDGFKIASADLEMRGPGNFIGTNQHGFPEFKAGDIIKDIKLIELAKETASDILREDPYLTLEKHKHINQFLHNKDSVISKIISVG